MDRYVQTQIYFERKSCLSVSISSTFISILCGLYLCRFVTSMISEKYKEHRSTLYLSQLDYKQKHKII